jgi:transposase InsO family protein
MGNLQHANARTTPRVRQEIQNSQESVAELAARLSLNPKTITKWRNADGVEDGKSGPIEPKSTLTPEQQAVLCEARRASRLSLDDLYIAFKDCMPLMSRSGLHRCLQRHGLSVLPKDESSKDRAKKAFKEYAPGFMHIDISQVLLPCTKAQGAVKRVSKYYLFVAIDRATKYVYVEVYDDMTQARATQFLANLIADYPIKITKILTDNGAQFTYKLLSEHLQPKDKAGNFKTHGFDALCAVHDIEHRLTKFRHPWTNGQVEIMNRVIKDATTKQFHYEDVVAFKKHLMAFLMLYNFQRLLKSLKFISPWQAVCQYYSINPSAFTENPNCKIVGLNS